MNTKPDEIAAKHRDSTRRPVLVATKNARLLHPPVTDDPARKPRQFCVELLDVVVTELGNLTEPVDAEVIQLALEYRANATDAFQIVALVPDVLPGPTVRCSRPAPFRIRR